MQGKGFKERRSKLKAFSDQELKEHFWQLTEQIVQPLIELAKTHTSPSIERSVLLRGGLSSIEVGLVVKRATEKKLLGLGAGNLVFRLSQRRGIPFVEAGRCLAGDQGWEEVSHEA